MKIESIEVGLMLLVEMNWNSHALRTEGEYICIFAQCITQDAEIQRQRLNLRDIK